MFLKKIGLATAGVALAAFGFVAAAQAASTNVNVFDGSGGALATNVSAFDWSETGSGLAIGVGPFGTPLTVGQTFTFDYQSFLTAFTTANAVTPTLVNTGVGGAFAAGEYEFTAAASFTEKVTGTGTIGPLTVATFDVANPNGTFSIFYDDSTTGGTKANVATGSGFVDGIEVARFSVISAVTTFSATGSTTGQGTATVVGVLKIVADFVNPDYIQGISGAVFDLEFQSNQQFPPTTSATSTLFAGGSGLYPATAVTGTDINFKVDGQNSFSIPEPQTLLLFGIGLLMLGFLARRGTMRAH